MTTPTRKTSKDKTSRLFNRYVWLVDLIHRHGGITFEEIDNHWQRSSLNWEGDPLPLRTFHNHRKHIEQMFEINIECDRRNGFKYYIDGAEEVEQGDAKSWLLNSLAINNIISESRHLKERILFESIPSGQKYLTSILEAMRENRVIDLTYQSFWRTEPITYQVHPYSVKVFKQRWYLLAYRLKDEKIITFSLDRIQDIAVTDEVFEMPDDFDAEMFFHDSFGIIVLDEVQPEKVVLKAGHNKAKYLKTLPLHHSQKVEEETDQHVLFSYWLRPSFDFTQEILSHGADVEVLEPASVRQEIVQIIASQFKAYQQEG